MTKRNRKHRLYRLLMANSKNLLVLFMLYFRFQYSEQ